MGVSATVVMSPIQKQTAMRNTKPVIAPIKTDITMARGACLLASFSSSVYMSFSVGILGGSDLGLTICAGASSKQFLSRFLSHALILYSQQHIPKAGCRIPIIPAIDVPNPVKFWKSLKTNDADCLFLLHASIVTTVTINETMLKISAPLEILSKSFGPHMLINVANKVIQYATRTVCHL